MSKKTTTIVSDKTEIGSIEAGTTIRSDAPEVIGLYVWDKDKANQLDPYRNNVCHTKLTSDRARKLAAFLISAANDSDALKRNT